MVSVVIPMYNAESTISKALYSIFKQTYLPKEIILVNDGSTDRSVEVVQEEMQRYQGPIDIKLVEKPNGGVSSARNLGMRVASGNFVALLDADDEWLPEKLEKQGLLYQENPQIRLIGTNRVGEHHTRWGYKRFQRATTISARLLLYKTFFAPSTVLFRRDLLTSVGYFDEKQRYAEEGDYWIRICHQHQCVLLNESLVLSGGGKPHFGHSGLSANLKEMEKGELKNMRQGLQLGIIGRIEYFFLVIYSILKYIRRMIIVRWRK